jgi:hypothetical protein
LLLEEKKALKATSEHLKIILKEHFPLLALSLAALTDWLVMAKFESDW